MRNTITLGDPNQRGSPRSCAYPPSERTDGGARAAAQAQARAAAREGGASGEARFSPNPYNRVYMIDPATLAELDRVKGDMSALLPKLGKHKIKELKRVLNDYYEKRFESEHKPAKYGSLNKGFTEEQLRAFFIAIDNEKYGLLFSFMAHLGLRIGEVVRVNMKDIKTDTRELRVRSEKTRRLDILLIPQGLYQEATAYIGKHRAAIDGAEGYLFYKGFSRSNRKEPYLEQNYVRRLFRDYVIKAGLDETYDISEEQNGRAPRKLHILTTHSLRHYAITHFYNQTKDWLLASRFARHLKPDTTMTYIHTQKEELYREIDKAFSIT